MVKGILGVFASLIFAVAVLGAIFWDLHDHSDQMVVEADNLEALIEQQRESNRATLYSHDAN